MNDQIAEEQDSDEAEEVQFRTEHSDEEKEIVTGSFSKGFTDILDSKVEERSNRYSIISDTYESKSAEVVLMQYVSKALELPALCDTLIRKISNRHDFDYRFLRSPDNMPRYENVSKLLEEDTNQFMIFTELIQVTSPDGLEPDRMRFS